MADKRTHYASTSKETSCLIKLNSNVKVTKRWEKVTCDNCKKVANHGWREMS